VATFDRAGIAERLRGLIGGQDHGDLADTAVRLGVEELSLRMSINEDSPHPTVEVLAAVIREYGIDPTWLLRGTYDAHTHRAAMEGTAGTVDALRQLLLQRPVRISEPTPERFRVQDQN